jgi:hypothetical protein
LFFYVKVVPVTVKSLVATQLLLFALFCGCNAHDAKSNLIAFVVAVGYVVFVHKYRADVPIFIPTVLKGA